MDYFESLDIKKEPFSNSPDPDFFYESRQHNKCLQKLELSIRLRRGLNVVVADVGLGKTTLCRQLIRRFASDKAFSTHLLLDPSCATAMEFLTIIAQMLGEPVSPQDTQRQLKERIKDHLFSQGVEKKRVIVLIIDEGQKLPVFCVEALREFLNYETNSNKLLQIVIFAQKEFDHVLKNHPNFTDRVSLYQSISPFSCLETKRMVRFRLREASQGVDPGIFTKPGFFALHMATGGYPRKIVELCHRVLLAMILQNKKQAGMSLVRSCARRGVPIAARPRSTWRLAFLGSLLAFSALIFTLGAIPALRVPQLMALANNASPSPQDMAIGGNLNSAELPVVEPLKAEPPKAELPGDTTPEDENIISKIAEKKETRILEPKAKTQPEPVSMVRALMPAPKILAANATKPVGAETVKMTNMWAGRFLEYSQIVFWLEKEVRLEEPVVSDKEALFLFAGTSSNLASFRRYSSFPGWVALEKEENGLAARIGLPGNLEGMEHFVLKDPFRLVVNLYHHQAPLLKNF